MENNVYLGLGSNLGERILHLRNAIKLLDDSEEITVTRISSIYETKPWGMKDQNNFFNIALKINTSFDLLKLFAYTKNIEQQLGRTESKKWGPREIDLDLLFFNDTVFVNDDISIPHKDIENRDFVLGPLVEIAPDFIHPVSGKKLNDYEMNLLEKHIINKYKFL